MKYKWDEKEQFVEFDFRGSEKTSELSSLEIIKNPIGRKTEYVLDALIAVILELVEIETNRANIQK